VGHSQPQAAGVTDAHSTSVCLQTQWEGLRSVIVTPLMSDGRVMGTFGLYSRHSNVYTHDDLRLLDAIATLASSAISNSMLYERTNELAIRDSLTGLYVRRYFYSRLKEEHRRALSSHKSLSVLMCDLDHFKSLNDQFGNQAGDLILTQFTQVLSKYTEGAVVARYGGEEFAVIFPETPRQQALQWAEQIRAAVEETKFQVRRQDVRVTVSIGLASLPDDTLEIDALVHKADEALYAAKKAGRNQVCSAL
jgi:diguanylate cyclase (GGDEF)-like protein